MSNKTLNCCIVYAAYFTFSEFWTCSLVNFLNHFQHCYIWSDINSLLKYPFGVNFLTILIRVFTNLFYVLFWDFMEMIYETNLFFDSFSSRISFLVSLFEVFWLFDLLFGLIFLIEDLDYLFLLIEKFLYSRILFLFLILFISFVKCLFSSLMAWKRICARLFLNEDAISGAWKWFS